jgi:hypothetical protein
LVEDNFPSSPPQVVFGPSLVPLVDTLCFHITDSTNGNNPPTHSLEKHYSCVVVEEVSLIGFEDVTSSTAFHDTMISQEEPTHFGEVPLLGSQQRKYS